MSTSAPAAHLAPSPAVPGPLDARAVGLMTALCLLWSLQQISLKAVAPWFPPMLMIGLRSGVAALCVMALMRHQAQRVSLASGLWRPGLVVGGLFALEYLLVGEGLRHTQASHISVFLYTSPIFAALGLHWRVPAERLAARQWVGIGLAFAGIAVAFLGRAPAGGVSGAGALTAPGTAEVLWGDLLGLLAGASWGATTVVLRGSRLAQAPATETLLYQLLAAFVLLMGACVLNGQVAALAALWPGLGGAAEAGARGGAAAAVALGAGADAAAGALSARLWWHLGFQALVVSFASFLVWFWMLRHYLASRLSVLAFMTPLFGVGLGVLLLGETLEPAFVVGAVMVLAGVLVVSWRGAAGRGARRS